MSESIAEKRVLVTGACGTIGARLVEHLLRDHKVAELVGIDNNESELFFSEQRHAARPGVSFRLADVRDRDTLGRVMEGADVVFHTAAFKHVVMCEHSPFEATQTNIIGVQNVVHAALRCGVERVIFTSSDKAVNPTNVMGTSKLMGERLMTAANLSGRGGRPVFASTRFGNVLGSRGSVIPIFSEQIRRGGPVTLTDPEMTRFIMSEEQAVRLVVDSATLARGGEIFVTKMPVIRIIDLAEVMIRELAPRFGHDPEDVGIETIGVKPGEKMYEELMSHEETRRAVELEDYFAVLPAFRGLFKDIEYDHPGLLSETVDNPYNSQNETPLDQEELRRFLLDNDLLAEAEREVDHPARRYWPGDKEELAEGREN
ncbi:SDR family NAD(P)-dependent oxidoreductase [Desulfohalovibrio reitneri]|uniref:SDR family NAD(P)-dependent oxidoreductase n=1 Tax=Desulfohalovibrio reitneri TaxID=1307759 RepID=UPI0004A77150|nr:SDR family NAD(P)-dependent oxidoreductase [Desulfohalovibrio reitneri]